MKGIDSNNGKNQQIYFDLSGRQLCFLTESCSSALYKTLAFRILPGDAELKGVHLTCWSKKGGKITSGRNSTLVQLNLSKNDSLIFFFFFLLKSDLSRPEDSFVCLYLCI